MLVITSKPETNTTPTRVVELLIKQEKLRFAASCSHCQDAPLVIRLWAPWHFSLARPIWQRCRNNASKFVSPMPPLLLSLSETGGTARRASHGPRLRRKLYCPHKLKEVYTRVGDSCDWSRNRTWLKRKRHLNLFPANGTSNIMQLKY